VKNKTGLPILLCLCINAFSILNAQTDTSTSYAPVGKRVDIGGWKLHIYGDGLHHQQGPTVIFKNGLRGFSFEWILIQHKLASVTMSYSYDRAGYP